MLGIGGLGIGDLGVEVEGGEKERRGEEAISLFNLMFIFFQSNIKPAYFEKPNPPIPPSPQNPPHHYPTPPHSPHLLKISSKVSYDHDGDRVRPISSAVQSQALRRGDRSGSSSSSSSFAGGGLACLNSKGVGRRGGKGGLWAFEWCWSFLERSWTRSIRALNVAKSGTGIGGCLGGDSDCGCSSWTGDSKVAICEVRFSAALIRRSRVDPVRFKAGGSDWIDAAGTIWSKVAAGLAR